MCLISMSSPVMKCQGKRSRKPFQKLMWCWAITPSSKRSPQILCLKLIQQPSVGYQHIDMEACTARGIKVANTAGANTISVAEHTIAWGLCLLKNMFHAHTSTKLGGWEQMSIKPAELKGKVWGIVGFGRIGQAVAERLKPFGLSRIIYHDTYRPKPFVEQALGVEYTELTTLLSQSDIISLHAPLTDATRAMINEDALNSMKPSAYLILSLIHI